MRLHRLAVRNYRGVTERELQFAATGVTLLHGPNEAGKSSMLEALMLLLQVKATSKAQRVLAACPTHRDAGPSVEAELTVGPYRFSFAKQYVKRPGTTLTVHSPKPMQLTGGAAESWVGEQIDNYTDGDLLDALTVLQGPAPGQPALRDSAAFAKALDVAAGGIPVQETGAEGLTEAVAAERANYFTPTGRPTGDLAKARAALAGAESDHRDAERALAEVDTAVAAHAGAAERAAEATASLAAVRVELGALAARETEMTEIRSRLGAARVEADAARQARRAAEAELAARRTLVARLDDALVRAGAHRGDRDRALADRGVLHAEAAWLATTAAEAAVVAAARRERKTRAQRGFDYARAASESAQLWAKLDQYQDLEKEVLALRSRLRENLVDRAGLATLTSAERRVEKAQIRVAALAVHLRVERLGFTDVLVDGRFLGEQPIELTAESGTEISVPGAVRIEVLARGEGADAATELRVAERALADTCVALGAEDADGVRELHEARIALDVELHETRVQVARVLGDVTAEQVRARAAEIDALVSEIESEIEAAGGPDALTAGTDALTSDADAAQRAHLEATAAEITAQGALRDAELQVQRKHAEVQGSSTAADVAAARLNEVEQAVAALTEELRQGRGQVSDDGLARSAAAAAERTARAATALDGCERSAAEADVAGFGERLAAARRTAGVSTRHEAARREELAGAAGRLESLQADGRRERWDRAEIALVAAHRAARRTESRARAVDLLRSTLTAHRDARRARVQEPFQRAVEELARVVFGEAVTITVGDDLRIESRTADGVTVPFDSLSGGAQEQLGVLARLACARLVDGADGAPVIFDDALGHSDPVRLTAMADALVIAGESAQVVVFSCVPGRFAALRGRVGVTEIEL